jgi:ribosomal protein S18 acetylase RimI-like enzyme
MRDVHGEFEKCGLRLMRGGNPVAKVFSDWIAAADGWRTHLDSARRSDHPATRMEIRLATEADIPLLRDLAQRIWRECYPGIITTEQIEFMLGWMYGEEEIRRQLAAGVPWEIAELDGEPIGYLSWQREDDGRVKISKLYVVPHYQRRGFGQRMLEHICDRAHGLGTREVWLQVNKRNERAIGAYLKAGFRIEKEAVFDIGGGFVMDDYLMARGVTP